MIIVKLNREEGGAHFRFLVTIGRVECHSYIILTDLKKVNKTNAPHYTHTNARARTHTTRLIVQAFFCVLISLCHRTLLLFQRVRPFRVYAARSLNDDGSISVEIKIPTEHWYVRPWWDYRSPVVVVPTSPTSYYHCSCYKIIRVVVVVWKNRVSQAVLARGQDEQLPVPKFSLYAYKVR